MSFSRAAVRRFNDTTGVNYTLSARRVRSKRQGAPSLPAHLTATEQMLTGNHGIDVDSLPNRAEDEGVSLPALPLRMVQNRVPVTPPLPCPSASSEVAASATGSNTVNTELADSVEPHSATTVLVPSAAALRRQSSELSMRCEHTIAPDVRTNAVCEPLPSIGVGDGSGRGAVEMVSCGPVEFADVIVRATSKQAADARYGGEAEYPEAEASESAALMLALKAECTASGTTIAALKQQLADARAAHAEVREALDSTEDDCKKLQKLLDESRLECADKVAACQAQLKRLRCLEKIVRSNSHDPSFPGAENDGADHRKSLHEYCCTLQAENDRLQQELHAGSQSERQSREMIRQLQNKVAKASRTQLDLEEKVRHLLQENVSLTLKATDLAKGCGSLENTIEELVEQRDAARKERDSNATKLREVERKLEELAVTASDALLSRQNAELAESLRSECNDLRRQLQASADELAGARSALAASEAAEATMRLAMSSADERAKQELEAACEAAALAQAEASKAAAMELRTRSEALASAKLELSLLHERCSTLAENSEALSKKYAALEARSFDWDEANAKLQHAESLRLLLVSDLESARAAASAAVSRADAAEQELLRTRALAEAAAEEIRRTQERLLKSKAQVEDLLAVNRQLSEKLVTQSALHRQIEEHRVLLDRARVEAGAQVEAAAAEKRALCSLLDVVRSECRTACDKAQLGARAESDRMRLQMDEYCRRIVVLQTKLCAANAEIERLRTKDEVGRVTEQKQLEESEQEQCEQEEDAEDGGEEQQSQQQFVAVPREEQRKLTELHVSTVILDHVTEISSVDAVHSRLAEGQPTGGNISRKGDADHTVGCKIPTELKPPVAVNTRALRPPFPSEMSHRSSPCRSAPKTDQLLVAQGNAVSTATPLRAPHRSVSPTPSTDQQRAHHHRYAKQTGSVTHVGSSPFRDVTNIRT